MLLHTYKMYMCMFDIMQANCTVHYTCTAGVDDMAEVDEIVFKSIKIHEKAEVTT